LSVSVCTRFTSIPLADREHRHTSSGGRLIFHIFSALAEFERTIIRERTTAGWVHGRAEVSVAARQR
jgi:DNA invertase Pin-like site-specific DNA recombinase